MASSPKVKAKPRTIDAYLAALKPDQRTALAKLRKTIRAAVPKAEEGISYGLPAFRLDGRWIVWFGAAARHCALYGLVAVDKDDLSGYDLSGKGTIRFQPDHPLPAALIRKLVKARIARTLPR